MPSSGRPKPGQKLALLHDDKVVIGVECERPFLMVRGLVVILAIDVKGGKDPVHVAVIVVERERDLKLCGHLLEGSVAICTPVIDPRLAQYTCLPGVSVSIVRVERECAVEQPLRLGHCPPA